MFSSKKREILIDIPEEELEELRMSSFFHLKEIARLRREFLHITGGDEWLSKETFLKIPCIDANPLRDRICLCFGYPEDVHIDLEGDGEDLDENEESKDGRGTGNGAKNTVSIPGSQTATAPESSKSPIDDENSLLSSLSTKPGSEETEKRVLLNFRSFLIGVSMFNSHGRIDEKLKVAFRIQDFDNDGIISRAGSFRNY